MVHRVVPDLTAAECREFVQTMATLAGSLWQIANPPPALAGLIPSRNPGQIEGAVRPGSSDG